MEIEPKPVMVRAGQVITRTHQSFIDLAFDSMEDDEHIWNQIWDDLLGGRL
jgi:hypothetical protein